MATTRATVYLDPGLYRAVKIKAAASDRSISDLVNEAVRLALVEDRIDLEAFDKRRRQSSRPFEDVLRTLKRDGLL